MCNLFQQQKLQYTPQEGGIYQDKVSHIPTERICTMNEDLFVQHLWHAWLFVVVMMLAFFMMLAFISSAVCSGVVLLKDENFINILLHY